MTRLTHDEKEILRPVIRRYARWPDAHDGPVFEAVEEIMKARTAGVVALDPEQLAALEKLVEASEGIMPVSVDSLVGMALDAFLEGAR